MMKRIQTVVSTEIIRVIEINKLKLKNRFLAAPVDTV